MGFWSSLFPKYDCRKCKGTLIVEDRYSITRCDCPASRAAIDKLFLDFNARVNKVGMENVGEQGRQPLLYGFLEPHSLDQEKDGLESTYNQSRKKKASALYPRPWRTGAYGGDAKLSSVFKEAS